MASKVKTPGLHDVMMAMGTPHQETVYAAFLKSEAERGDHTFLLNDIKRSKLQPAAKAAAIALITGNLKRKRGTAPSYDTELKEVQRALRVLELEEKGWAKHPKIPGAKTQRLAAEAEATRQLSCGVSAVQKALGKYEKMLKAADPETLNRIRTLVTKSQI